MLIDLRSKERQCTIDCCENDLLLLLCSGTPDLNFYLLAELSNYLTKLRKLSLTDLAFNVLK